MQKRSPVQGLIVVVIVAMLALLAYSFLTMPDRRSTTDRVGDAVHELPHGVDAAGKQLEDRTPSQKIGDAIEDTGKSVKEHTGE